ncbi:MAG: hypothetical protein L0Z53_15065 [Acidobacteriales bacterium]|nr:hypothetical protein [Terriglobales bacterium]
MAANGTKRVTDFDEMPLWGNCLTERQIDLKPHDTDWRYDTTRFAELVMTEPLVCSVCGRKLVVGECISFSPIGCIHHFWRQYVIDPSLPALPISERPVQRIAINPARWWQRVYQIIIARRRRGGR